MRDQLSKEARGLSRPIRRRAMLAGAGGIALPLVVACRAGRSASPTKANAGGAPQRGGTLNISNNFDRGFDPHTVQASDTSLFGMFYSSLVRANPKTYDVESRTHARHRPLPPQSQQEPHDPRSQQAGHDGRHARA